MNSGDPIHRDVLAGRFEAVAISAATAKSTCDDESVPFVTATTVTAVAAVLPREACHCQL